MNTYEIFRNLKRWLSLYGISLLDLILPVIDYTSNEPYTRYDHFNTEFDKHFNLLAYYQSQAQPDFPLVLVSFTDISDSACWARFRVTFDIYFETISPDDCKDFRAEVCNTPESILAFQEAINMALCELMRSADDDMRAELFDDKPWEFPMNWVVDEEHYGEVNGVIGKEILHIQTSFDISDNLSRC